MNTQLPGPDEQTPRERSNEALQKELYKRIPWLAAVAIAGVLAAIVLFLVITSASAWLSGMAETVAQWFMHASLDPTQPEAFERFVRLVLLTGAAIGICALLKR